MDHTTDLRPGATVASILMIIVVGTVLSWLPAQAQVGTNDIDNGAVTSPKIRDRQVKTPDIEDDAITSDKIRVGAVGNADYCRQLDNFRKDIGWLNNVR